MNVLCFAETAVLGGDRPCIVYYHGDSVKLGKCFAGWADRVAVLLSQKQEVICVASRP